MTVYKYNIINPAVDKSSPYIDKHGFLVLNTPGCKYRYFAEATSIDEKTGDVLYYILLSYIKFDNRCHVCNTDMFGRTRLKLHGMMKTFIINTINDDGIVNIRFHKEEDGYDVYLVD